MSKDSTSYIQLVALGDSAAGRTCQRWPEWSDEAVVTWRRVGLSWRLGFWSGDWVGPMGGHYSYVGLSRRGISRRIRRELARWDRKRRV